MPKIRIEDYNTEESYIPGNAPMGKKRKYNQAKPDAAARSEFKRAVDAKRDTYRQAKQHKL